jgi:hypothetical protein
MTLEERLAQVYCEKEHELKGLDARLIMSMSKAALSWFKEQLPKEKEISENDENIWVRESVRLHTYNQCLQDILTSLEKGTNHG